MPPPLVIFDFDGTIADSRHAIGETAQVALEAIGQPRIDADAFHQRIGLPLEQIFAEVVPALSDSQRERAVAAYREKYADISRSHTKVFDGMREILSELRRVGSHVAIATGKSTRGAHRSIARLELDPAWFDRVLGNDAVPRPKPHPDMVLRICAELDVPRERAIVVGDTTFDVEMSVAAGVRCCGVTWGSHDRVRLLEAGATWVVDSRPELADLLA